MEALVKSSNLESSSLFTKKDFKGLQILDMAIAVLTIGWWSSYK